MADEIRENDQVEVEATEEEVDTAAEEEVVETETENADAEDASTGAQEEKKSTVTDKVIFWVANAVTLCVCVLLVVFVWLR